MPPVSKNIPVWTPSMEQEEHQRQHAETEETAEHQLRHPAKANDTTTSASREENVVSLAYKMGIDDRDKSNENVGMMSSMVEGRDEDSKRKGSTSNSTSFAFIDDRDYQHQHRPSLAFTKSTDTRDNELSPVGSGCGSTPFTRKGPEALIQRLEEEQRIVFVPQEQQQNSTASTFAFHHGAMKAPQERDEISPCYAGGDPLAISEDFVYPKVVNEATLSPLMEREHIVIDLQEHELPSQSSNEDDDLPMEDVPLGPESPEAIDCAFVPTETSLVVVIPPEREELSCLNSANGTQDDETPALAAKLEADANAPGEKESDWVADPEDPPRWVLESFVALAMAPESVDHELERHHHQQQGSKTVDLLESAAAEEPAVEEAAIQPIVVTASGTIKTDRDAILLACGAASFASDENDRTTTSEDDLESGQATSLDGTKEPGTTLVRAVSESFLCGLSTIRTHSMTLKRTVSEPIVLNPSISPVQGNDPSVTTTTKENDKTLLTDARLKEDEDADPSTVDAKVSAKIEGKQSSSRLMTDQDMNIKIDAARKASLSTSVGAFSEIDPRAAFDPKDKTEEKLVLTDIPVQSDALSPSVSTDVEMAFARSGVVHTPNTSSPGAYHEGGNRGVNMGFSRSSSGASTMFSSDETIDEPAPLTAQLVDEDKLRLQAERDAEEALRRLMDQAVQGQAIVIGDEGELDGDMDASDKRKKEQPRKMYRRCLALAFILICGLVVTVVMLTRPVDQQPEPPVVPEVKTWIQIGPDIDGEQPNESWGSSVALSANATMLAGAAFFHDLDGINSIGRVRVFRHDKEDKNQWVQLGQDLYGDTANDEFGFEVSFSPDGSLLAIGAGRSNDTDTRPGYVRVFRLNSDQDSWEQLGQDLTGEGGDDDLFGYYLAVSNNGIAVGAPDHDGTGSHHGAVRVFRFDENVGDWYQVGQTVLGEGDGDEAGVAVDISLDGNILAVGAWLNDGNGEDAGHVRVFRLNEEQNEWLKIGSDIDSEDEDDSFGFSVSLSADGTIVAAGAPWNDMSASISNSGHVRVFKLDPATNDWVQMGNDINGQVKRDNFGYRVRLSDNGKTLAASSFVSDGSNAQASGHVRVFDFDETTQDWVQRGSAIDGEATGDEFGQAISLSADGQVVAAGAVYATNEEGIKTGHIGVFRPIDEEDEEEEQQA